MVDKRIIVIYCLMLKVLALDSLPIYLEYCDLLDEYLDENGDDASPEGLPQWIADNKLGVGQ